MIWFTSDTHFGHEKIIHLAKRPFKSMEEMDEVIIQKWNQRVKPGDIVYHLGDFALKQTREQTLATLKRLRGQVHLITGNHEDNALAIAPYFADVKSYKSIKVGEQKIVLFHYPIRSWDGIFKGAWHLFGHVHGMLKGFGKSMDVGVDTHDFYIYSFDEVKERMDATPKVTEEEGFPGYVELSERFK